MPYANSTPNYQIPWQNQGEIPSAASNKRAAYIIDNQIRAAVEFFGAYGIISEGTYNAGYSPNQSVVVLQSNSVNAALTAVINSEYIDQMQTLTYQGIPDNTNGYLYVIAAETNLYTSNQFSTLQTGNVQPYFNTTGISPANSLFLGTVQTTTSGLNVNTSPTAHDNSQFSNGKVYVANFNSHRTKIPIDHPNGSVGQAAMMQGAIVSQAICTYDGFTSGTNALSGTGIASPHIKNYAIQSNHLNPVLFISGLATLVLSQNYGVSNFFGQTTFSGLTQYPYTAQDQYEIINLQTLQNAFSGIGNGSSIASLESQVAALQTSTTNLQTFQSSFIVGQVNLNSGTNSISISYPSPLPSVPRFVGVTPEISGHQPPMTFKYITSGTNGGFIAVFSGVTIDTSTIAHYQAIL